MDKLQKKTTEEAGITVTAYHKWLIQTSGGDKGIIVELLQRDALQQHDQAWELLEHTGDENLSRDTFLTAAENLIELCQTT